MDDPDDGTDGVLTPQQLGGATKRARNRERLLSAVDYLMKRQDSGETVNVSDICEESGVSSATFYTLWKSRNELCIDAFVQFVVEPLEATDTEEGRQLHDAARGLIRLVKGREKLLQAALIGRLERSQGIPMRGLKTVLEEPDEDNKKDGIRRPKQSKLWLRRNEDAEFVERIAFQLFQREYSSIPQSENPKELAERRTGMIGFAIVTAVGLLDAIAREDYAMVEAVVLTS